MVEECHIFSGSIFFKILTQPWYKQSKTWNQVLLNKPSMQFSILLYLSIENFFLSWCFRIISIFNLRWDGRRSDLPAHQLSRGDRSGVRCYKNLSLPPTLPSVKLPVSTTRLQHWFSDNALKVISWKIAKISWDLEPLKFKILLQVWLSN